jgi:hypothetical protein
VVPQKAAAELQPNDVGVFGPLSKAVGAKWLNNIRWEPPVRDDPVETVLRHLEAWDGVRRETVRSAWVKPVSGLKGRVSHKRGVSR